MKIGVNLLDLHPGHIGGMEQYVRNLIQYCSIKESVILYLFLSDENFNTFLECPGKIIKILIGLKNREFELHSNIFNLNLDIWFCPLLILEPKYVHIPSIVTIPDIQHEFYPEFFSDDILDWRRKNFQFSVKNADKILTLSNYSKSTIVSKYDVPPEKIDAIYLDADDTFNISLSESIYETIQKYELPDNYILYPANFWEHKNHYTLIQALAIIHKKYGKKVHLVLTGQKKFITNRIKKLIKKERLSNYIHITGYVDQADICKIYLGANLVVFPSLFEGFGIPLIEAMRCKCPIVCSDRTSIPEIVGDAAIYFNPENSDEIAEKIVLVLESSRIRDELIEKGNNQGLKFSWENTSEKTLHAFKEVFANRDMKQKLPLVSIITPSYNQGQFIKDTIESVLSQDYPNIEYIIMDGGSTDNTLSILQSYGDKLVWLSEKDDGQADAVNKGIQMAKGDIVGWLNSDDTYAPHAIKNAVTALLRYPEAAVVYGESSYISESGEFIGRYLSEPFNYMRLAEFCIICQPSAFIRKDILMKNGCLNKNLHLCMDYDLWMRIGKKSDFIYLPILMAQSRMYEQNKTLSRRGEVFQEIISTVHQNYGYVPIGWIYGLIDYKMEGRHTLKYYLWVLYEFIYLHRKDPYFLFINIYSVLRIHITRFFINI